MLEGEQSARGPQSQHLNWFSSAAPEGSASARRDDHVPEIPVSHRNLNLRGRGALLVTVPSFSTSTSEEGMGAETDYRLRRWA